MSGESNGADRIAQQDGNGAFERIQNAPKSYIKRMRMMYVEE